jgi:oligopeptidase A
MPAILVCDKVLAGGVPRAYFYLDPYSRPAEKRGGAWMAEVRLAR